MLRKLIALNGLAIFAVVVNHAGGWGQFSLIWWSDSYLPVTTPYWGLVGSWQYYLLLVIRQICIFCVPVFIFTSGFFVSYAAKKDSQGLKYSFVWNRIISLVIPYLIWTLVIGVYDYVFYGPRPVLEYVELFFTKGIISPFWFVPCLCYCYLLAPLIVKIGSRSWKTVILVTLAIQVLYIVLHYFSIQDYDPASTNLLKSAAPFWSPIPWIFLFSLGVYTGFHTGQIAQLIQKYRYLLWALVPVFAILNILETDELFRLTKGVQDVSVGAVTYTLYSITFIFAFLTLTKIPLSAPLSKLGGKTFGIYLIHYVVIEISARAVHEFLPQYVAYLPAMLPVLIFLGLGLPLLMMRVIAAFPTRQVYKYLFG